ncbi:MAG: hypothetical protein IPK64_12570 [bacterium]|nr:hypothetical protein [bacterium]
MGSDSSGQRPAHQRRLWPDRPRRQARTLWWLVAATVVVAGAVFLLGTPGCGKGSFADLADRSPLPTSQVDMSTASPALTAIFNLGMAHYANGDWPAAADQLGRAHRMVQADPRSGPENQPLFAPFVRMYQGVAHLLAGQLAEASEALDEVADPAVVLPLRERGLWYGAQCRLLQGDAEGALALVDELGGSPVYAQQAREQAAAVRKRLGR